MKSKTLFLCISSLLSLSGTMGQLAGTAIENQPSINVQKCTSLSSCTTVPSSVTIDANWRWIHDASGTNCYNGNSWNNQVCSSPESCADKCVLESVSSAEYKGTYGIQSSGSDLSLGFVTQGAYSNNIGSRVYLMETPDKYQLFQLLNKEFTIDVDSSALDCGLNGALYFVEMSADGGKSAFSGNKAGAKYGTGYCDAQCPHDVKFINGEANLLDWGASGDVNSGSGRYGTCCPEMDIWEANKMSTAYTPHPCNVEGQTRCSGNDCGDGSNRYGGVCDKDGCDFNSYRMGNTTFYGPDKIIDSKKPVTVVTQFITDDNTDNGDLVEIRRIYKQNGEVIYNSKANFESLNGADSLTDDVCNKQKFLFGEIDDFAKKGGMKAMGESLKRGMVLTMSLWVDYEANCLWLDSNYPINEDPNKPGVARGSCPTSSGLPSEVIASQPQAMVKFSNIRWGPIGSTVDTGSNPTKAPTNPPTNKPTNPPTNKPTNPPTNKPTNPPTNKPTNSPTNKPTNPPTNKPTNVPTSKPTNAPPVAPTTRPAPTTAPTIVPTNAPSTNAPVTSAPVTSAPVTSAPVTSAPVTSAPVTSAPVTSAPVTSAPTFAPTSAPGTCAGSFSISQTQSGGWSDGTEDYTQWQATITSSQPIYYLQLATGANLQSFWQVTKQTDGTFVPDDYRLNNKLPVNIGDSVSFGYIVKGTTSASLHVIMSSCDSTSTPAPTSTASPLPTCKRVASRRRAAEVEEIDNEENNEDNEIEDDDINNINESNNNNGSVASSAVRSGISLMALFALVGTFFM